MAHPKHRMGVVSTIIPPINHTAPCSASIVFNYFTYFTATMNIHTISYDTTPTTRVGGKDRHHGWQES